MPDALTSWEDLLNLGWPKEQVVKKALAARGVLYNVWLNEGLGSGLGFRSYNTLIGVPQLRSRSPPSRSSLEHTSWSYDNTKNDKPFTDNWKETWTTTISASLSILQSASITLNANIDILNIASTGYGLTTMTESHDTQRHEETYDLSHIWKLEVGPHEKLSLVRVITTTVITEEYDQTFGLTRDSLLGTMGEPWRDDTYWGLNLNNLLGSPVGKMTLQGVANYVEYGFRLVREGPKGKTIELLAAPSVQNGNVVSAGMPEPPIRVWAAPASPSEPTA